MKLNMKNDNLQNKLKIHKLHAKRFVRIVFFFITEVEKNYIKKLQTRKV